MILLKCKVGNPCPSLLHLPNTFAPHCFASSGVPRRYWVGRCHCRLLLLLIKWVGSWYCLLPRPTDEQRQMIGNDGWFPTHGSALLPSISMPWWLLPSWSFHLYDTGWNVRHETVVKKLVPYKHWHEKNLNGQQTKEHCPTVASQIYLMCCVCLVAVGWAQMKRNEHGNFDRYGKSTADQLTLVCRSSGMLCSIMLICEKFLDNSFVSWKEESKMLCSPLQSCHSQNVWLAASYW